MNKIAKTLGGILLISGTQIGAGMLVLPLSVGITGAFNTALLFISVFTFMLTTLFLTLEANDYCKDPESNIISMARELLNRCAELIAWFAFLCLLYSILAAYTIAGSSYLKNIVNIIYGHTHFSDGTWKIIFTVLFIIIVNFGTNIIDKCNRSSCLD